MLKVLIVLFAAAMPLQSAMADQFSAKSFSDVPQSVGEVKEAKLWIWIQDEDSNCAGNTDRMVKAFYSIAAANEHPRLSLWDNGQPKGPTIAIAVKTIRISYGSEPLRCLASLSYQFGYFEEYHGAPQARIMTRAYASAADLKSLRTLILFGRYEAILSRSAVARVLQQLPDLPADKLRVALYPNGYHLLLRDLDALTVYDDVAAWIKDPAAPLLSGADDRRSFNAKTGE